KTLEISVRTIDLQREKLQRNGSVQLLVEGLVDDAHSALAELGLDLVMENLLDSGGGEPGDATALLFLGGGGDAVDAGRSHIQPGELQKCSGPATRSHGKPSELDVPR